jgi:hypothetical protein
MYSGCLRAGGGNAFEKRESIGPACHYMLCALEWPRLTVPSALGMRGHFVRHRLVFTQDILIHQFLSFSPLFISFFRSRFQV